MPDPRLLRSFAALADTGSFPQAAERLNMTRSTISQQLARLEEAEAMLGDSAGTASIRIGMPDGIVTGNMARAAAPQDEGSSDFPAQPRRAGIRIAPEAAITRQRPSQSVGVGRSPSSSTEPSTPIAGTISVPRLAIPAGRRATTVNQRK